MRQIIEPRAKAIACISADTGISATDSVGLNCCQIDWYRSEFTLPGANTVKLTVNVLRCLKEYLERHDHEKMNQGTDTLMHKMSCPLP